MTKFGMMVGTAGAVLAGVTARALAPTTANSTPQLRPENMPDKPLTWRENRDRLAEEVAKSPLPTRQLKRMAARQLARAITGAQKRQERKDRLLARKSRRAQEAAAKHAKG